MLEGIADTLDHFAERIKELEDENAQQRVLLARGSRSWGYLQQRVNEARIEELEWCLKKMDERDWTGTPDRSYGEIEERLGNLRNHKTALV